MWTRLRERAWTTPFAVLPLLGMILLVLGPIVFDIPQALASLAWPRTPGLVIGSEITETWTGYPESDLVWCPHVSFAYTVGEVAYMSERIDPLGTRCDAILAVARKVVEPYPAGQLVEVRYDSRNPAFAILKPGIHNDDAFSLLMFTAAICVGVFLIVIGLLGLFGRLELSNQRKVIEM